MINNKLKKGEVVILLWGALTLMLLGCGADTPSVGDSCTGHEMYCVNGKAELYCNSFTDSEPVFEVPGNAVTCECDNRNGLTTGACAMP